jgi:hypothetical protein
MRLPEKLLRIAMQRHRRRALRRAPPSAADPNSQWVIYCAFYGGTCGVVTPQAPGTQIATLSGLSNPQGVIVGPFSGYWYVANTGASNIPYYANDIAGNPFQVFGPLALPNPIEDANEYPADIAIRETGKNGLLTSTELAVSNIYTTYFYPGSVTVFTTSGSNYSSYNLADSSAYEGEGVAFDNEGDCFWAYNVSEDAGPGYIDKFTNCQGSPTPVSGISLGFGGGIAFDNYDNLWYVDQLGQGSQSAGVYECKRTSHCILRFGSFTDPVEINFDTSFTNLYVSDAGAGEIYQCAIASSGSCAELVAPGASPIGVAVNSVQAAGDVPPSPAPSPTASPLTPQDLWKAYNLGKNGPEGGKDSIVVIVEPGPNGTVASDMTAFRTKFNLFTPAPPFVVYDQRGNKRTPSGVATYFTHSSGVTQMAAANCPKCTIYLVEANSENLEDLHAAFETAKTLIPKGTAGAINNSYGGSETSKYLTEIKYEFRTHFTVTKYIFDGIWWKLSYAADLPVTASSANYGYQRCGEYPSKTFTSEVCYPASSPDVIAVGGTMLAPMPSPSPSTRPWSEVVASFATSGCSKVFVQPGWQPQQQWDQCLTSGPDGKPGRNVADIAYSAVNDGVIVNNTYVAVSGTSFAAPAIAALYAAAGIKAKKTVSPIYVEGVKVNLAAFPVSMGNNDYMGNCIPDDDTYLCDAAKSLTFPGLINLYNGPTGWGTPNGLGIFKL